jgi:hypothetical protein
LLVWTPVLVIIISTANHNLKQSSVFGLHAAFYYVI